MNRVVLHHPYPPLSFLLPVPISPVKSGLAVQQHSFRDRETGHVDLRVLCLPLTPHRRTQPLGLPRFLAQEYQAVIIAKVHRGPENEEQELPAGTWRGRQEANLELPNVSWMEVTRGGAS